MIRISARRRLVALVTAAFVVAALVTPAFAGFPGDNGRIAFVRGQSIVSKSPGSNTLKTLVSGLVTDPNFSANGKKIVFLRGHVDFGPGWFDIWTMNADGSGKKRLTTTQDRYSSPSFRPDGKRIIVTVYDGNPMGNRRLITMNVDGSDRKNFAPNVGGSMADGVYSPSGTKVAYAGAADGKPPVIRTIAASGKPSSVKTLAAKQKNASHPDWSPKGDRLVFTRGIPADNERNVVRVKADGSGVKKLADFGPDKTADGAVWSPNGKKIAFERRVDAPTAQDPEIWTMNPDGSGKKLQSTNGVVFAPTWQPK